MQAEPVKTMEHFEATKAKKKIILAIDGRTERSDSAAVFLFLHLHVVFSQ